MCPALATWRCICPGGTHRTACAHSSLTMITWEPSLEDRGCITALTRLAHRGRATPLLILDGRPLVVSVVHGLSARRERGARAPRRTLRGKGERAMSQGRAENYTAPHSGCQSAPDFPLRPSLGPSSPSVVRFIVISWSRPAWWPRLYDQRADRRQRGRFTGIVVLGEAPQSRK